MIDVVPLRYGTAFKKAFSDPEVLSAFVRDVLGVELHFTKVEQEKAFLPPVGKIDVRFDLFAEDEENRAIVELQHVREIDAFSRFYYYHLVAQIEQVSSNKKYAVDRTVYTIVVLTRLPQDEHLRFDLASQSSDIITHDGRPLGLFMHRIVFVNPRALSPSTPPALRHWLELFEDSLDRTIDETAFPDPLFRRVIDAIETTHLSPQEAYWFIEEAEWEDTKTAERREGKEEGLREGKEEGLREGERKGRREGKEEGLREGKREGLQQAITDLCDVLGIELNEDRKAQLKHLDIDSLEALRGQMKRAKAWPR